MAKLDLEIYSGIARELSRGQVNLAAYSIIASQ
jgi:hypothetical protein